MYIMVMVLYHFLFDKAMIATAKLKFKNNDYLNADIHESRFSSTENIKIFPDYFHKIFGKKNTDSIIKQKINIFKSVSKIINFSCYSENNICFYIFGGDLIINDNFKVKLLEINEKPILTFSDNLDFYSNLYENIMQNIVDKYFVPSNNIKPLNNFIELN